MRTPARDPRTAPGPTIIISSRAGEATDMDYNATLTFTPVDGVDDDELVDYYPAVGPSDLVPGAREAVITLPAASLSQAITTVRAVAAPLGVLHGLEIVPTAAWGERRTGTT